MLRKHSSKWYILYIYRDLQKYSKSWFQLYDLCANLIITLFLSGEPDYFGRNKISSGGDLSHYSSASMY